MAQFDMRGQNVTNQYNAGRDMNFGAIQTPEDLVTVLEQLTEQITQAKKRGMLNEDTARDTQDQITRAVQQARKPDPDKRTIIDCLAAAKSLLAGLASSAGLVTAIAGAIEAVQKLFS